MVARAFITGVGGPTLSAAERSFLREAAPWGLILFTRNIETPDQVRRLTADFRDVTGNESAPVLVDQEGGRVQRFGPPHWPRYPAGADYGELYDHEAAAGLEAAWLGGRLIANDLLPLGVDVDCLPLADVPAAGADPVIGNRAYGETPEKVAALAGAVANGLMAGGVLPVLKHLPGHGRATADSHQQLPMVSAERALLDATDFAAFRPLTQLPMGMTAHVVFTAFDPIAPATTSATMVAQVIRDSIGFKGLLMSDDLSMGALSGTIGERVRAALAAGCDVVLHCNGNMREMEEVAAEAPRLAGEPARRAEAALAARKLPDAIDLAEARKNFEALLAGRPTAARMAS